MNSNETQKEKMKTIIERPEKSRCQVRHTMIKESLNLGFTPMKVSDEQAQELCRNGRKFVYVPKSLNPERSVKTKHYINTKEFGGWNLKKI
jgi:hypothetical protein